VTHAAFVRDQMRKVRARSWGRREERRAVATALRITLRDLGRCVVIGVVAALVVLGRAPVLEVLVSGVAALGGGRR
jgi:hypothetical protein